MKAWIIYQKKAIQHNRYYIDAYFVEGKKLGIQFTLILEEDITFGIQNDTWFVTYKKRRVKSPDFVIVRTINPLLTKQLEYVGMLVYNNGEIAEICNDKAKTYQYLAGFHLPMIPTRFCKNDFLCDYLTMLEESDYRDIGNTIIIKSVDGHGGKQVFLYHPYRNKGTSKLEIMKGIKGSDVVIQPLYGNGKQDLRVYVIGKSIVAAILRTAKRGFRSNFSLGGEVTLYSLSKDETLLINTIIHAFDFGLVGIDFLIDQNGKLILNEIEDVVGARMLYQCTNINLVERYLTYIKEKVSL